MPEILELKEIDGEIWARVGNPPDFPSGVALWTPDEQARERKLAARDAIKAIRELTTEQIDRALHDHPAPQGHAPSKIWLRGFFRSVIDEVLRDATT